ncbi:MAG: DUF4395 domain-containing protein [Halothiobacillaceae bacterium]|jgi:hypothetical protein|nr:DUF4395 domain-containing protein [Halothiobacillaceae bacterium]
MLNALKNLWFRDTAENPPYINDIAVRIRAGMLLAVPLFMALTLWDAIFGPNWVVDGNTIVDTYETDWDGHTIYAAQVIKRTWDYTVQTGVLFYALFEMLAGMSRYTARLSPTILIASLLASRQAPVWKPLLPKRFAWSIGASFIVVCLVFFNPEIVAGWVNALAGREVLSETENYMPYWIPLTLVWVCLGFMWLEAILGFCVGCKVHALLVRVGVLKDVCEACNNIDWDEIERRRQARKVGEAGA